MAETTQAADVVDVREREVLTYERFGIAVRDLAAEVHEAKITAKQKRVGEARQLFDKALRHNREVGNPKRLTDALEETAEFLREQGELSRAYALLGEAMAASRTRLIVNQCVAHDMSQPVADGDEVAFLPPMSGG